MMSENLNQQPDEAWGEGRRAGLEEAANLAESAFAWYEGHGDKIALRIADEIRARIESPNKSLASAEVEQVLDAYTEAFRYVQRKADLDRQ